MAGAFSMSPLEALKQAISMLVTDSSTKRKHSHLHAMGK